MMLTVFNYKKYCYRVRVNGRVRLRIKIRIAVSVVLMPVFNSYDFAI